MTVQRQTYAQHARAVLTLGLPLVGSHLAQVGINLTDTIMLGWYDLEVLAGQVLGGMIFFITFIAGSGFAWAITPLVAEAEGRGDTTQARRVTRMSLWIVIGYAVALVPVMLSAPAILRLAGQEAHLADIAGQYLSIAGWSLAPALAVMVLKSHLSALERANVVLWVTLAAVAVNALGNYALIFGHWGMPELGVRGSAISTLLVHVVSLLLLMAYVRRATPEHQLFRRFWRADPEALGTVFRLGWPIGLTTLAEVGLFASASLMMGWIGPLDLAAHGIAIQIASMAFVVHVGLSNTATIRVGRAVGRNDPEGLKRGAHVVLALSAVAVAVTVLLFLLLPETLIGLFTDPADPDRDAVIAIGVQLLAAAALFQAADAAQVMALGLLRGIRDTKVPMIFAGISYWVLGMPASYLLGFVLGWGGVGIWLGLALGLGAAGATMMTRFWTRSLGTAPVPA